MPHIIVEHSLKIIDNKSHYLSIFSAIREVFTELKDVGNFDISQCKFRAVFFDCYLIGDNNSLQDYNSDHLFFHLTVKIMQGRAIEIRNLLADKILLKLQNIILSYKIAQDIEFTIDIVEMNRDNYRKTFLPSTNK